MTVEKMNAIAKRVKRVIAPAILEMSAVELWEMNTASEMRGAVQELTPSMA